MAIREEIDPKTSSVVYVTEDGIKLRTRERAERHDVFLSIPKKHLHLPCIEDDSADVEMVYFKTLNDLIIYAQEKGCMLGSDYGKKVEKFPLPGWMVCCLRSVTMNTDITFYTVDAYTRELEDIIKYVKEAISNLSG